MSFMLNFKAASAKLRILDLPDTVISSHIFSFLRVEDIVRASILCCRTLAVIGKQDKLWEKEWRRISIQKYPTEANVDFSLPSRLKGKLYRLCCRERNTLFYNKLEELRKKRRIAISRHGPLRALRDLILHDLEERISGDNKISISINFGALNLRPSSSSTRYYYPDDFLQIPLVNAARRMQSRTKWSNTSESALSNLRSIRGARLFSGSLCMNAKLPENYQLMIPPQWRDRKLISNETVAEFNYFSPHRKARSIGYSKFCSDSPGYTLVGNSNDKHPLILESYPISPPSANTNSLKKSVTGSLAIGRWHPNDHPVFVMASLPLAMLELEICPLKRWKQLTPMQPQSPGDSNIMNKYALECTIHLTVRTFGILLWEHSFSSLGKSCQGVGTMLFNLLGNQQSNLPIENLRCAQELSEGLCIYTQTGFKFLIPFALVLDVTLFNHEGQVVWAQSQPVQCHHTTKKARLQTNLEISTPANEILLACICDPITNSRLTVEFCVGSSARDDHEKMNSTYVQEVILEVNEETFRSWIFG